MNSLENESLEIFREAYAFAENPVLLYSIGKDSSVLLHLAMKAFYPSAMPMPLLHVDTTWKFQEMYRFRDSLAREKGVKLHTHINADGLAAGVDPFASGTARHTQVMKTEALRQALDHHKYDVILAGARRDEEKSRAKERIFSFRDSNHAWDPKSQRPELWNLYNTDIQRGESIRVFPLSNWTEIDIWQYIYEEDIDIVPLYLAKVRPVVERDGQLIMVDDERFPLQKGEKVKNLKVRFRTLGCWPLTAAIESDADTLEKVIEETLSSSGSEREGRLIDKDSVGSMEKKKREGYF